MIICVLGVKIGPTNLPYINNFKVMIYICNIWTTLTCLYVKTAESTEKSRHFIVLIAGWIMGIVGLLVYEYLASKTRMAFYQRATLEGATEKKSKGDDREVFARNKVEIIKEFLLDMSGITRLGAHKHVEDLMRMIQHTDHAVQCIALQAMDWVGSKNTGELL